MNHDGDGELFVRKMVMEGYLCCFWVLGSVGFTFLFIIKTFIWMHVEEYMLYVLIYIVLLSRINQKQLELGMLAPYY